MPDSCVVLMAYGSPQNREQIAPYLAHIRGGEGPSAEGVADLARRYDAIGGRSPLQEITRAQAEALERALCARGSEVIVRCAMKHSAPFVDEVVREASSAGAREFLGVALAPHFARMSIGAYEAALRAAADRLPRPARADMVRSWHLNAGLIEMWAEALRAIRRARPEFAAPDACVLFSAHSLPARIAAEGDPYSAQLRETCERVAKAAGVARWSFAWQSAGSRGEWLGPPLNRRLTELSSLGVRAVLSAPVGFVAEHLEVLYDLDIEARGAAERLGLAWARAPMPNASPRLIAALAQVVEEARHGPLPVEGESGSAPI
jgi:ferrochelatase